TVKVFNFDNTTVMLPPYTLVSTSFQNWRSMSKSGTRRIAKSILIDADTIRPDEKDPTKTNLDNYRAYILDYLNKHPRINHDTGAFGGNVLTMVRLMPATASGVPVQFYAFTNTSVWPEYEEIQSTITAHILAAAPQFGLRVYNYPATQPEVNAK
ncbi:MAG: mechanosensitive ion channel family protein, partial [Muribaculaceae bacterium]|nr:mechanosensitive ion channel family protein [Muribaculaceae bacterium]